MSPITSPDWTHAAAALAAALGCGLLIGVERERRKGQGPARAFAGLRTFALVCVSGAVAALLPQTGLVLIGAAFVAALGVVAYARDRSEDVWRAAWQRTRETDGGHRRVVEYVRIARGRQV